MSSLSHTVQIVLALNARLSDDENRTILAVIPPLLALSLYVPTQLYDWLTTSAGWVTQQLNRCLERIHIELWGLTLLAKGTYYAFTGI